MKPQFQALYGAAIFLSTSNLGSLHGQLIHRYSFSNTAGNATGGLLTDSVGGAHGVVQGAGALFTGGGLDLPGGSSDTAAYGDLPNNLISVHSTVTVEGWVTIDAGGPSWTRIFDFGSTEGGGEITGPGNTNGGGAQGLDYFMLSASRGADHNVQRIEIRNEDPAGGGVSTLDSGVATVFGDRIHFAVTWEDTGVGTSQVNYWRDGVQMTTDGVVNSNLADLNDVNMWLGRSTWLNDGNLDATFDEFRIYDEALTTDQINVSRTAGPDAVIDLQDDSDNDQIPTAYEDLFDFLDPNDPNDAALDEDSDGLSNLQEFQMVTAPDDDDTDDDGLKDGTEVNIHSTNPLLADSDGDGLNDGEEINDHSTNPALVDTDGDGINDGPEITEGLDPLVSDTTEPTMIHRYTFDNIAGPAAPGALVPDLIGGADGTIVGSNGVWTGSALTLPGGVDGATADAAYVDLPNGIISSLSHLTFEAWYTVHSADNWARIWDFGSTASGELSEGNSGASNGQDYFMFAPNRGTDFNTQRIEVRNLDALSPGGGTGPVDDVPEMQDTNLESILDQEYHVAGVWTSDSQGGAQLTIYRDGVQQGTRTTTFTPRDINDINNWLGRSNWTGDSYLNGDLNEFRIYSGAMNDAAAAASFAAGPDSGPGSGASKITEITYDKVNDTFTLSFTSRPGQTYAVYFSNDLIGFSSDVDDDIPSGGQVTTFGPFANPDPGADRLFFRVSRRSR